MLPIPALRSFCAQISILLTFNFIAICTLYPVLVEFIKSEKAKVQSGLETDFHQE